MFGVGWFLPNISLDMIWKIIVSVASSGLGFSVESQWESLVGFVTVTPPRPRVAWTVASTLSMIAIPPSFVMLKEIFWAAMQSSSADMVIRGRVAMIRLSFATLTASLAALAALLVTKTVKNKAAA